MTFIRPEAKAVLWRWREVLAGLAVAALGLLWATGPRGLLGLVGWVLVAAGVVLVVTGVQRLRFRRTESGPGLVEVDEGKITYFGPLSGGSVAARDLEDYERIHKTNTHSVCRSIRTIINKCAYTSQRQFSSFRNTSDQLVIDIAIQ